MGTMSGMIVIGILAAGVLALIVRQWMSVSEEAGGITAQLPAGVTFTPSPLLTEQELTLYNLVRLAVQDDYLVFAHVPLWAFLKIEAETGTRTRVYRQIALRTVDMVLVHPGSRQVAIAVQIVDGVQEAPPDHRAQIMQDVLAAAGIRQINLSRQQAYTVPSLMSLFGIAPEEP